MMFGCWQPIYVLSFLCALGPHSSVGAPIVGLQYVISPIRQVKRHWILVTAAAYTVLYCSLEVVN